MPRVITLDKESKRRLRAIRWPVSERASAATQFLLLVGPVLSSHSGVRPTAP
jgi:hypothetical protein